MTNILSFSNYTNLNNTFPIRQKMNNIFTIQENFANSNHSQYLSFNNTKLHMLYKTQIFNEKR